MHPKNGRQKRLYSRREVRKAYREIDKLQTSDQEKEKLKLIFDLMNHQCELVAINTPVGLFVL